MRITYLLPVVLTFCIWTSVQAQEGKERGNKAEQSARTAADFEQEQVPVESIEEALLQLDLLMVNSPAEESTLDACEFFMDHYGIRDDRSSYQRMADHWLTHTGIGADFIKYHRLLIESVEKDAVIFTNASEDSYPLLALMARGHDQKCVIPSYWISDPSFDPSSLALNGFPLGKDLISSIRMFADANPDRPIHLALTMPHDVLGAFRDESIVSGLSIALHSPDKAERNLRKTYHKLSIQRKDFNDSPLESNFLPTLLAMHGIAKKSGDEAIMMEISQWGEEILRDSGQTITWEELSRGQ